MNISIEVPRKSDIINGGFQVKVATEGESWSKDLLGSYADKEGVYIHHSAGRILYIGKTTNGEWGNFSARLRREFQETSSGSSDLFKGLNDEDQTVYSYLIDKIDLNMMINTGSFELDTRNKAFIMEQTLIGIYEPPLNKDK